MNSKWDSEHLISWRHEKYGVAILSRDILHPEVCCTESCASLIREAASQLAREGYRKLVVLHVESRVPELLPFFESLGFLRRKEMHLFEADLAKTAAPSATEPPKGVAVSSFQHIRLDALYRAIQEAFVDNPVGFSTTAELDEYVSDKIFLKSCSFFASASGEIVSFLMAENREPRIAYLAYLGTLPQWRRHGIGSLLTEGFMYAASKAGLRRAAAGQIDPGNVAVIRLLEKTGFHLACSQWNMTLELRSNG